MNSRILKIEVLILYQFTHVGPDRDLLTHGTTIDTWYNYEV